MKDFPRGTAYRLETEHLVLQAPDPARAPIAKQRIDRELEFLAAWLPWARAGSQPLARHVARLRRWRADFDRDRSYEFELTRRSDGEFCGCAGLHQRAPGTREIGYWVAREFTGRGLATEASAALCWLGFRLGRLARLELRCDPENRASARVAEKLGFRLEGLQRSSYALEPGVWRDTQLYGLLASEYDEGPAASFAVAAYDVCGEPLE